MNFGECASSLDHITNIKSTFVPGIFRLMKPIRDGQ